MRKIYIKTANSKRSAFLTAAIGVLFSQPALAQFDCSSILSQGIYDTNDTLSTIDKVERFARHICSNGNSSIGGGGTFVISGVSIGGSYNSATHSSVCDDVRNNRQLSVTNINRVKTINPLLVDAWNQCISQSKSSDGLSIWAKEEYDTNWISGEVRFKNPVVNDNQSSIVTLSVPNQIRDRSCQLTALNQARRLPNSDKAQSIEIEVGREASFQFRCQRRSTQPAIISATNSLVGGIKNVTVRELTLWPRLIFDRYSVASKCVPIQQWRTNIPIAEITVADFAPDQTIYLRNRGGNGHAFNRDLLFETFNSGETSTAEIGVVTLRRRQQSANPAERDIQRDGLVISAKGVAPRLFVAVNSRQGCSVNNWSSRIANLRINFTQAHDGNFVFGRDLN